jgi:hypothetical protein
VVSLWGDAPMGRYRGGPGVVRQGWEGSRESVLSDFPPPRAPYPRAGRRRAPPAPRRPRSASFKLLLVC